MKMGVCIQGYVVTHSLFFLTTTFRFLLGWVEQGGAPLDWMGILGVYVNSSFA